jgi:hypothetical protein
MARMQVLWEYPIIVHSKSENVNSFHSSISSPCTLPHYVNLIVSLSYFLKEWKRWMLVNKLKVCEDGKIDHI